MGVTKEKELKVAALKEAMTTAQGVVFTTYKGLTVLEDTQLRRELRAAGVTYKVVKNTLTAIAAKEAGLDDLIPSLNGTTAMADSLTDAVAPAKIISEFVKKNKLDKEEKLVVKAGIVDGTVIDVKGVTALADLPSREVLIAKMLGSMQAPLSGTVSCLSGIIRNAVYVLEAIRKQKEGQGAA